MRGTAIAVLGLLAATRATAECKVMRIAELPVTMQGFRPMVDARIDDKPVRFIVDSGMFFSDISPGSARELGLALVPASFNFRLVGVGGDSPVSIATVKRFSVADTTIPDVQFLVGGTDLQAGVGTLGQNFLGIGDVEYDLAGGAVRLFKESGCAQKGFAYWSQGGSYSVAIQSLDTSDRHTTATVKLDGVALAATFDTGASSTIVSLRAAARAGVRPGGPGVVSQGFVMGFGRQPMPSFVAHFDTLEIGTEALHNVRLRIADLGPDTDMLIGADYFMAHRMYVSNAQRRIDFTYNGGRIFDANTHADAAAAIKPVPSTDTQPTDAEGYARRSALAVTARDQTKALADLDHAVAMAPNEPRYRLDRARLLLAAGRPAPALADLDAAVSAAPNDVDASLARSELRLRLGDRTGARADIDHVAAQVGPKSKAHLEIAEVYSNQDQFAPAIAQFGLWLAAYPDDPRRAEAFNGRCWARALADVDLPAALADCNAALRVVPGNASFLDSRGLVELRLGRTDRAIADYDAALAGNPRLAFSLYGRGIAERRLGQTDKASADLAAAAAVDSTIAARAERAGIR